MSVEKVREMVSRDEVMEELTNDEVTLEDKIKECLKMIGNNSNIDVDFFVDAGRSMLLPLYDQSRRGVAGVAEAANILNTQIQASTIMRSESRLWLEAIYRRLAGRRRVRNPFQCEITRDIPHEFFRVLFRVTKNTRGFAEPFVSFGADRKAKTMSFTT